MTSYFKFNLNTVDPSWQPVFNEALAKMDPAYLDQLSQDPHWLPGPEKIFSAFSLPTDKVNYVLVGESPYPRKQSANGYAFWDAQVNEVWSAAGLHKTVNRATSLRNMIKMLLIAEGLLDPSNPSQDNIAAINKNHLVQTNTALFTNFLDHGFLLLNASLVLQATAVKKDAMAWHPFIKHILNFLFLKYPHIKLLLFGNIANTIDKLIQDHEINKFYAEHPYNISFITNPKVINFFKPLHLLRGTIS